MMLAGTEEDLYFLRLRKAEIQVQYTPNSNGNYLNLNLGFACRALRHGTVGDAARSCFVVMLRGRFSLISVYELVA